MVRLHLLSLLGLLPAAALFVACNSEVFVAPLPEITAVDISPDGGRVELTTGVDGAYFLSYETSASLNGHIYGLDENGEQLGSAPIGVPLPGGIEVSMPGNPSVGMTIMASTDGQVTIDLDHCYSTSPFTFTAILEYRYGFVEMPVCVQAIEPFKATSISYTSDFAILPETDIVEGTILTANNQSADTTTIILHPLRGATAGIIFLPSDNVCQQLPVDYEGPALPLPSINHGSPSLNGLEAPYRSGQPAEVPAIGLADPNVRVAVPPQTKRTFTCFIERNVIAGRYNLTLSTPSVRKEFHSSGSVKVSWPVGYLIGYRDDLP